MVKTLVPAAAMERILKKAGAERVSEDAKDALKEVLEDYGDKIGKKAIDLAKHSGRKTIKKEDIKLAAKS